MQRFPSLPVLSVLVCGARFSDLLAVLHPVALLMGAVGAGQVALQCEAADVPDERGVFRSRNGRLCNRETAQEQQKYCLLRVRVFLKM